jgi:uncharacterized low-complexity protein
MNLEVPKMANRTMIVKPVAAVVGVAFVSSLAVSSTVIADDNPFASTDLDNGYMMAGGDKGKEGKCGEGKCGGDKGEMKGEEGSCGGDKGNMKGEEGSCGGDKGEMKGEEGKCGAEHMKDAEGKCGGDKG